MKAPAGQWYRIHVTYAVAGVVVSDIIYSNDDINIHSAKKQPVRIHAGNTFYIYPGPVFRVHATLTDHHEPDTNYF